MTRNGSHAGLHNRHVQAAHIKDRGHRQQATDRPATPTLLRNGLVPVLAEVTSGGKALLLSPWSVSSTRLRQAAKVAALEAELAAALKALAELD